MSAVETAGRAPDWGRPPRIWWHRLRGDRASGIPEDRATIAQLRRCHTPLEAFFVPATLLLLPASARAEGGQDAALEIFGAVAVVLAHIREDVTDQHVARAIGREQIGAPETALVSELRFRHLVQLETVGELMTGMRRLVKQLRGRANVDDLARSMLWWFRGENTRRRWAFDYYAAGIADPSVAATDRT